jgi:hypothetical protein
MAASYLHDSLQDLASAARALVRGATEVKVVFMDEPGEHELIFRRADEGIEVEVLWYDGWKSLKSHNGQAKRKLLGRTTVAHVRGQVLSELRRLLRENGEAGYQARWIKHVFPAAEMRTLEAD